MQLKQKMSAMVGNFKKRLVQSIKEKGKHAVNIANQISGTKRIKELFIYDGICILQESR